MSGLKQNQTEFGCESKKAPEKPGDRLFDRSPAASVRRPRSPRLLLQHPRHCWKSRAKHLLEAQQPIGRPSQHGFERLGRIVNLARQIRPDAARAPAFGRVPLELLAVFLLDRAGVLAQLVEDRAVQVTVADVQIELGPHPSRAGEPNRVDYAAGSRGERIPVLRLSHLGGGEAILLAQVVYQPLEELAIRLLVFAIRARFAPRPVAGVLATSLDMARPIAVAIPI